MRPHSFDLSKCYWDVVHDWGLGSLRNHGLRARLELVQPLAPPPLPREEPAVGSDPAARKWPVSEVPPQQGNGAGNGADDSARGGRVCDAGGQGARPFLAAEAGVEGEAEGEPHGTPPLLMFAKKKGTEEKGPPEGPPEGALALEYRPSTANHLFPLRVYYGAMAANALLRLAGPLVLTMDLTRTDDDADSGCGGSGGGTGGSTGVALQVCLLASAEVLRRGLWSLLRMENRHQVRYS